MWGKGGYGKIRFKSYLKDIPGVTPLTWWSSEDFGNSLVELTEAVGIKEMKNPFPTPPTVPKKTKPLTRQLCLTHHLKKGKKNNCPDCISLICVCNLVHSLPFLTGTFEHQQLAGEIIFKHASFCPTKDQGEFKPYLAPILEPNPEIVNQNLQLYESNK